MHTTWAKRVVWTIVFGLALAGLVWFAWPQPIPVDLARVSSQPAPLARHYE